MDPVTLVSYPAAGAAGAKCTNDQLQLVVSVN